MVDLEHTSMRRTRIRLVHGRKADIQYMNIGARDLTLNYIQD